MIATVLLAAATATITTLAVLLLSEVWRARRTSDDATGDAAGGAAPDWVCECGHTAQSARAAHDHAADAHDAPREGPHWQRLYTTESP